MAFTEGTALLIPSGVIIGLVIWALRLLMSVDKKIDIMDTWKDQHDKQDDERHNENLEKFDRLFERLSRTHPNGSWERKK